MQSAGVAVVLEKGQALSAENNVFQTQTCAFSDLLEAPKFDMRKAYECRIGAVLAGKRTLEERGPLRQSSREQEELEEIFTPKFLYLYNFLIGLKGAGEL